MPSHKLVAFDRPLSGATIPGRSARFYSESEVAAIRTAAYQEGADSTRGFANQQLVEFRADVQALQDGIFQKLATVQDETTAQLQQALPALVLDLANRLLAGFVPTPEQVASICQETLSQLFPEKENLELVLSTADAAALDAVSDRWKARYPGLRIQIDATFRPGDCQVRSRFGLTDARLGTKLGALQRELRSA